MDKLTNSEEQNNKEYERLSSDFLTHLFETSFSNVQSKTENIKKNQEEILSRIDSLNSSLNKDDKSVENYKRCVTYYEKAGRLKKELMDLNEKCNNLKKRSIYLKEFKEQTSSKNIQIQQKVVEKKLEDEKKLAPILKLDLMDTEEYLKSPAHHHSIDVDIKYNDTALNQPSSIPEAIPNFPATVKVTKKLKNRSNTLEHKIANKIELND